MRTKFLDYDARRTPKTEHHCIRCQKDLKPGQPVRWIHCVNGGMFVLHPDDESSYVSDAGDMGCWPIGNDCARILGIDWTHPDHGTEPAK